MSLHLIKYFLEYKNLRSFKQNYISLLPPKAQEEQTTDHFMTALSTLSFMLNFMTFPTIPEFNRANFEK